MLREAFVTEFFKNIRAQGNNGQNKGLLVQKAVEAWTQYFGRYGYLIKENKRNLTTLVESVLKDVGGKAFLPNKIEFIVRALNVVIPRNNIYAVTPEVEDVEDANTNFNVPNPFIITMRIISIRPSTVCLGWG